MNPIFGRSNPARLDLRSGRRPAMAAAPLLVLVLAVLLSACGGSSTASPAGAPSSAQAAPAGPPGTTGTIAAVAATSLEVQNPRTGQVTVDFTDSTTFSRTVPATAADVTVGECVLAMAAPAAADGSSTTAVPSGPVAVTSVIISQPTAQGCRPAGGGGFPGGGSRTGQPSGAPPSDASRAPGASRQPGAGRGRGAFGKVTAVTTGGFTVEGTDASNQQTPQTQTVTTSSSTTYTKTEAADHTALVVGQCATAVGPSDDTGAVTASSISVRPPGTNGCTFGAAGGRGRGGQGGQGGQPGQSGQQGQGGGSATENG